MLLSFKTLSLDRAHHAHDLLHTDADRAHHAHDLHCAYEHYANGVHHADGVHYADGVNHADGVYYADGCWGVSYADILRSRIKGKRKFLKNKYLRVVKRIEGPPVRNPVRSERTKASNAL